MATPIRPGFQTPNPQAAQRPDAARSAAQRAFFNAALGNTAAPSAPPSAPQAQQTAQFTPRPAQPAQKIPTSLPAEPPARIMRPGSFLDIKV